MQNPNPNCLVSSILVGPSPQDTISSLDFRRIKELTRSLYAMSQQLTRR